MRQEAAVNMVPVDELKEKALISLAKVFVSASAFHPDVLNIST